PREAVAVALDETLEGVRRVELAVDLELLDARTREGVGDGLLAGRCARGRPARGRGVGGRAADGPRAAALGAAGRGCLPARGAPRPGRGRLGLGGGPGGKVHRGAGVPALFLLLDHDVVEEPPAGAEHLRDRLAEQPEVVLLQPLVVEPARQLDRELGDAVLVHQPYRLEGLEPRLVSLPANVIRNDAETGTPHRFRRRIRIDL